MGKEQFLRTEMLLGEAAMERLASAHVAVFGLGGVGSWCAEALARSGVGRLTLVDNDQVGLTNLNRQCQALHSTIGAEKTEAMADKIRDINPDCVLRLIPEKYEADSRERFFTERYDYIVDAIDLVSCKLDLIETALARDIPIISSMGTGNKLDPSQFRVADISKTEGCALARILRMRFSQRQARLRHGRRFRTLSTLRLRPRVLSLWVQVCLRSTHSSMSLAASRLSARDGQIRRFAL